METSLSMNLQIAVFLLLAAVVYLLGRRFVATKKDPITADPGPVMGPFTQPMATTLAPSEQTYETVSRELVRAGIFHGSAPLNFFASRNAAVLMWLVFSVAIFAFGFVEAFSWKIAAALGGGLILIYGLPRVWLSSIAESRAKKIQHDLPDALDMLTMVVSGGLTTEQALLQVVDELKMTHPELATELRIVHRQSQTASFDQSMKNFAQRMDVPEITALTNMMRHNSRIGGKAVDALREFADSLRHTRQVKAEEDGNKASIKLLLPVVFCLAPPIYVLLLGPALLELKNFVSRENRPGGALQPSVSAAQNPGMSPDLNDSASSRIRLNSATSGPIRSSATRLARQPESSLR